LGSGSAGAEGGASGPNGGGPLWLRLGRGLGPWSRGPSGSRPKALALGAGGPSGSRAKGGLKVAQGCGLKEGSFIARLS
jgi:hypothetical protein